MLQIGPLALPWGVIILLCVLQLGGWVARRLCGQQADALRWHSWALPAVGLLAARLGFVVMYPQGYAETLWQVLDIRDGGWLPGVGFAAALLYGAVVWLLRTQRLVGRALLVAVVAAGITWWFAFAAVRYFQAPPSTLPELSTVNLSGEPVDLQGLKGKPLVINLWASWCPPCVREMPVLLQGAQHYPEAQFVWLNQQEGPDVVVRFARQHQLPASKTWFDLQATVAGHLGLRTLPSTLFYDADGQLQAVRTGELSASSLSYYMQRILPKPSE